MVLAKGHGHAVVVMGMAFVLNAQVTALFGEDILMCTLARYAAAVVIVKDVKDPGKRL